MRFLPTQFEDAKIVELDRLEDPRGYFARTWCQREFADLGMNPHLVQTNVSFNWQRATLRGMHYQLAPHAEAKLVRCTRGAIYDVIVDLRRDSDTYGRWEGFELSDQNLRSLYVPEGFAHGFLTLVDNTEIHYQMSEFFEPESARGFHWNDPSIAIQWPLEVQVISPRDENFPSLDKADLLPAA